MTCPESDIPVFAAATATPATATPAATAEVDAQAPHFVWSGRPLADWRAMAPRDIAALVRAAAVHLGDASTDYLDPAVLARYDLVAAVGSLSPDDRARLLSGGPYPHATERLPSGASNPEGLAERTLPRILPAIDQSFRGPGGERLIRFLGALKHARAQQLERAGGAGLTPPPQQPAAAAEPAAPPSRVDLLVAQALARLDLSPAEQQAVVRDYRRLHDGLAPLYEEIARRTRRVASSRASLNQEREDRVGFALYRTVEAVVTFYWEPVTLAPAATTAHFLRRAAQAAYNDWSDTAGDSRGIEVHGESDAVFGPARQSVEGQAQDDEVYALLMEVCAGDPRLYSVAWGHIIDGVGLAQLSAELGLPPADVRAAWSTVHTRLQAALRAERRQLEREDAAALLGAAAGRAASPPPDQPTGRRRGTLSPLWGDLVTRNAYYRERLRHVGQFCLLDCQRVIFGAALDVATPDRHATIRAVAAALGDRYSEQLIRRQIQVAADLLERTGGKGRNSGNWLTKAGKWQQQRATLAQLSANPNFWQSLPPHLQELIDAYYLQPTTMPTHAAVGARLSRPVDDTTVSRRLSQLDKIVAMHG
jgi:hypothetical protein